MSSPSLNPSETSLPGSHSGSRARKGKCSNWSTMNIATMVLGFVFFWPFGLFMVFWILSGRNARDIPAAVKGLFNRGGGGFGDWGRGSANANTGNTVFDEFQQTQYDRISEIKQEIAGRYDRFQSYRDEAKRKADEQEFNNFMNEKPTQS